MKESIEKSIEELVEESVEESVEELMRKLRKEPMGEREFDRILTARAGKVVEEIERQLKLMTRSNDGYQNSLLTAIFLNQITLKLMFLEAMVAEGTLARTPSEDNYDHDFSN